MENINTKESNTTQSLEALEQKLAKFSGNLKELKEKAKAISNE